MLLTKKSYNIHYHILPSWQCSRPYRSSSGTNSYSYSCYIASRWVKMHHIKTIRFCRNWLKKSYWTKNIVLIKKSTIFVQSSYNLVKMISSWVENIAKIVDFLLLVYFWASIIFLISVYVLCKCKVFFEVSPVSLAISIPTLTDFQNDWLKRYRFHK